MEYIYVTDDNLQNKQDYMYSAFEGKDFLEAYKESRQKLLATSSGEVHDTAEELRNIRDRLQNGHSESEQDPLDNYVKRFEVSKRLYAEYDKDWHAKTSTPYDHIELYVLLAECCLLFYRITGCTKYYSCLLKVDDTMLSLTGRMTTKERRSLASILNAEMLEYECIKNRIFWGGGI